ncbi:MAG: UDP-N-acetylmuramoyl-tripeptide--D-alanyl-D-alanine ligase [Planctomyces sp.]|nr:UDP-N-acetylmuramoyl-tripeptide--D-alanyl-D-alanine ligase [Planctomyces sp.]
MKRHPMKLLATMLGGRLAGDARAIEKAQARFSGRVSMDTRTLAAGDLFVALSTGSRDGHEFLAAAQAAGAAFAIIESAFETTYRGARITLPVVIVDDSLLALQLLAASQRDEFDGLVIGVTGSVGKTSTRDMLHTILKSRYTGRQSPANFNNSIGLPLSLLELDPGSDEFVVLEMGAGRRGDIAALCDIAQPEIGIITSVGLAHLETFGTPRDVADAKGELFESLPANGTAVFPGHDPFALVLRQKAACRTMTVGEDGVNDWVISHVRTVRDGHRFTMDGQEYLIRSVARHFVQNAGLAIAVAREIGLSGAEIADHLAAWQPVGGRCALVPHASLTILDDCYNASPSAMAAALRTLEELGEREETRTIAVIGDMAELGEISEREHRRVGQLAGGLSIDFILAIGRYADIVAKAARATNLSPHRLAVAKDVEMAWMLLECWIEEGDAILVKGSRSMGLERITERLKTCQPALRDRFHRMSA